MAHIADRVRVVPDKVSFALNRARHAPADLLEWVTDPIFPERIGQAIAIVLFAGAFYTGVHGGMWLVGIYLWLTLSVTIARDVKVIRYRLRAAKQAKQVEADVAKAKATQAQAQDPS